MPKISNRTLVSITISIAMFRLSTAFTGKLVWFLGKLFSSCAFFSSLPSWFLFSLRQRLPHRTFIGFTLLFLASSIQLLRLNCKAIRWSSPCLLGQRTTRNAGIQNSFDPCSAKHCPYHQLLSWRIKIGFPSLANFSSRLTLQTPFIFWSSQT